MHPYKREFIWLNRKTYSRIDYIWASRELSQGLIDCKIIDADYITGSDHKIVQAQFTTGFSQKGRPIAISKRLKGKKQVLKLEKATEEDQEVYRTKLDTTLKKNLT